MASSLLPRLLPALTLDHVFHNIRSLAGNLHFFRQGWGEFRHQDWLDAVRDQRLPPPEPLELAKFRKHPVGLEAELTSPAASWLPIESRTGRVWVVEPPPGIVAHFAEPPPVIVQLPATGDHGPFLRYCIVARQLAARGITSVLLEGAFYGRRRPVNQSGAKLCKVYDLADLGRATIEEACGLLAYWAERGHKRLVATGISQGGLHAAMCQSLCTTFPVHYVSSFAPASAAPVFTRGCLSECIDWPALVAEANLKSEALARDLVALIYDSCTNISNFPESPIPAKQILLAAKSDSYIGSDAVDVWRRERPNIQVRKVRGGHVTAVALRSIEIRRALLDVLVDREV
jgi:Alpha/beta hydrolase domain containing 18